MVRYAVRRLVLLIPTLLGVSIAVFLLRGLIPGDPVELMFFGQSVDQETIEIVRRDLGLDRPLPEQYLKFLLRALQGDLGTSIQSGLPVTQEILNRYPATLYLAISGTLVAIVLGVSAGVVAAIFRDRLWDTLIMAATTVGQSMPSFWLGLLLISLVSVRWGILPVMGSDSPRHLILPALTIGLITSALIARMTRSTLLEVLNEDYVRTARAKGLREMRVVLGHAMRNAALPVVTIVGLQFGNLLAGAFIVEVVFSWPGVGEMAVTAINQRDYPVIQGILLVVSSSYVIVNTAIDVLYGVLDPRVAYD
ncbi:nickel ABC transporter permease [Sphaerobacter sp.]|uniref:nickel ABC transporter permease n=1 Tax=Sphaerobacter sp. TaxID=2099654 RepID=UPI001D541F15|nr:nickel ABC transporter permease [Sphaerobacter sp.]MBX5445766.1 ABC transporter permease [Sphaerobacter sp.]